MHYVNFLEHKVETYEKIIAQSEQSNSKIDRVINQLIEKIEISTDQLKLSPQKPHEQGTFYRLLCTECHDPIDVNEEQLSTKTLLKDIYETSLKCSHCLKQITFSQSPKDLVRTGLFHKIT